MRVLITGGAGCIGSEVASALVERGDDVVVFDNLSSGRLEHLEPLLGRGNFRFVHGDVLNVIALEQAIAGVNEVWHLAANPDVKYLPGEATDKDLKQNVLGTYNVLESMRRHGIVRLAFTSTSAVYGLTDGQAVPETAPTQPISLYGASKLACEALIRAFQHLFEMRCCIFRLANIVGSKTRKVGATVISDFIRKLEENPQQLEILGNGRQTKSYLLSSDCVAAMLWSMTRTYDELSVYNIGSSDSLSVTAIADMVVGAMGLSQVQYVYTGGEGGWLGDVPRFVLDVSRINALGWRARYNSEQAVSIAIRQMLARRGHESTARREVEICKP
jgi:UDP-glucose 4-epimerase